MSKKERGARLEGTQKARYEIDKGRGGGKHRERQNLEQRGELRGRGKGRYNCASKS